MPLHPHKRPLPGSAARATAFFYQVFSGNSGAAKTAGRKRGVRPAGPARALPAACPTKGKGRSLGSDRPFWWRRVDSNHRRRCQQIYSLPPLATRELLPIYSAPERKHRLSLNASTKSSGAGERNRTINLLITNQLLCRLSYTSKSSGLSITIFCVNVKPLSAKKSLFSKILLPYARDACCGRPAAALAKGRPLQGPAFFYRSVSRRPSPAPSFSIKWTLRWL